MNRAFVTGASGFIGAAVARRLVAEGVPTAVLLRPTSQPWRLGDSLRNLTVIEGAFHEPAGYEAALADFAPDTVFHLAWQGVGRSRRDDPEQVRINVPGTIDLFLAAVRAGAKSFIAAGSQAEYGPSDRRIDEGHPTHPASLYGAAKLASLTLLERLAAAHAVRLAWLRVFSVYGPQDDEGTLLGSLVPRLLAGERPAVTSGTQLWDYLHVDDAAAEKKGNGFVARPPAPSSLRGRHAQGGDILIPASTNWCESGDWWGAVLLVRKESRFKPINRNLALDLFLFLKK